MTEDEKTQEETQKTRRFAFGCQASFGTRRSAWAMSSSA